VRRPGQLRPFSAADKSIRIGVVFTSADSPYIGVAGQGSRWIPPVWGAVSGAHVMFGTRDSQVSEARDQSLQQPHEPKDDCSGFHRRR